MKKLLIAMALFCGFAACTGKYPTDVLTTRSGEELKVTFFGHASLSFEFEGKYFYVDPVGEFADFSNAPKADFIVITHEHGDHLDPAAISAISSPSTVVIANRTVVDGLGYGDVMLQGQTWVLLNKVTLQAVPAYNTSPDKLQFHPEENKGNGYVLSFGGTRVYVAGDTEPTPEMMNLQDIDVAFLPVNQPYTMTEEQAASVVKTIYPSIFYPYHTGQTDQKTNLRKLVKMLDGTGIQVRVRPMK